MVAFYSGGSRKEKGYGWGVNHGFDWGQGRRGRGGESEVGTRDCGCEGYVSRGIFDNL